MFNTNGDFCSGITGAHEHTENSEPATKQVPISPNLLYMEKFRQTMQDVAKTQSEREKVELLKSKREATGLLLDNALTSTKVVIGAAIAVIACTAAKKYFDEVRFLYRYE